MDKREVWISINGDYCAFHEMSFDVEFDCATGEDLQGEDRTEEWFEDHLWLEYTDYEKREAYLIDGKYYVEL
jgi:hypothetical protein